MILNGLEYALMNNPVRALMHRHIEGKQLLKMGGPLPGGRALEVGCGRGVGIEIILDQFGASEVSAFDLDPRMVERARKRLSGRPENIRLDVGDAASIEAADASFDGVFDFGIIHHVPDWRLAVNEIARVLKSGGRLYGEEMLRAFICHPVARRLFDHPMEDRFDASMFLEQVRSAGLRLVASRNLGESFLWFVAEKE